MCMDPNELRLRDPKVLNDQQRFLRARIVGAPEAVMEKRIEEVEFEREQEVWYIRGHRQLRGAIQQQPGWRRWTRRPRRRGQPGRR